MLNSSLLRACLALLLILQLQACDRNSLMQNDETAIYNIQLGLAYLQQGNTPRAKEKLLTALAHSPNSPEVNTAMAYFMEQTGERKEARKFYKKALMLAPHKGAQINNYGRFLCKTGHYQEAEQYFIRAAHDLNYIEPAKAYENAGLCALQNRDEKKAISYFKAALKKDPTNRGALFELVSIELKQNNVARAWTMLFNHRTLVENDAVLLKLARSVAKQVDKGDWAADYRLQQLSFMDDIGVKNERTTTN